MKTEKKMETHTIVHSFPKILTKTNKQIKSKLLVLATSPVSLVGGDRNTTVLKHVAGLVCGTAIP
jgi:hypothetical protein